MAEMDILNAYRTAEQGVLQRPMQDLQQVGALQAILGQAQKQQLEQAAMQRDAAGRAAIAGLPADANSGQLMQALRPFVSPEHLYQWTQAAETRKDVAEQTKQSAMARLSQQIQRDAAEIAHKARTATTAEEKFHWQQQMDTLKAGAAKQASEIAAGRYNYDTGMSVAPFQGVVPQAGAPAAPAGPQTRVQFSPNVPPEDYAAAEAAANGTPTYGAVPRGAPPAAAPVAAPQVQPAAPNNLDARDLRLPAAPAQAPAVATPVAAPAAAQTPAAPPMPQFTGSPRQQAEAKNRYLNARVANSEPLLPVKQDDGSVVYVPRSQAAGMNVGSRTTDQNIGKQVQQLGRDFEKANLPQTIAVLEEASKITPELAAFVTGPKSTYPDMLVSQEARTARQDVAKLFNIVLKDRSGAAVTNQELERLKNEFGQGIFKTPEQLMTAIAKAQKIVDAHYRGIGASYGKDVLDAYNANLSAVGGKPLFASSDAPAASASPSRVRKYNPATGQIE